MQHYSFSYNNWGLLLSVYFLRSYFWFFFTIPCKVAFVLKRLYINLGWQPFISCFYTLPSPFPPPSISTTKALSGTTQMETKTGVHMTCAALTGSVVYKLEQAVPVLVLTNSLLHSSAEISPWIRMKDITS